jgi:hypothetical protein
MGSKAMIRLLFRHAVARRFSVRSVAQDYCSGYARFHSFNTTRISPVLFPGFSKRPASRRRLIEAHDKK